MFKVGDPVTILINIPTGPSVGDVGRVVEYRPNKRGAYSLTISFDGDEYPFYEDEVEHVKAS